MSTFLRRCILAAVAGTALLAILAAIWFLGRSVKETEERDVSVEGKSTLFATMLVFNSNEGLKGQPGLLEILNKEGWSSLRTDDQALKRFLSALEDALMENADLAGQTDFSSNRDVVGAFVWNVIEPARGKYDWTLTDATLEAAGEAAVTLSAVVQPFAAWDQSSVSVEEYQQECAALDFGYYDFKAGPVNDWDAYEDFLTATVERYDGDGQDDMPGLSTRVEAWEIGNESEGRCGGYNNDPEGYAELLARSYRAIKQADSSAIVLNAGALEIVGGSDSEEIKNFWQKFFELGADVYLDVFNFHYNRERNGANKTADAWTEHLDFFNDLMDSSDERKPIWVTEFGTYSGTPEASLPPGASGSSARSLPTQSEEFQAAWYFRYSIIGFSNGVERIFIDLEGGDDNGIGASALFRQEKRGSGQPRSFLTTLQGISKTLDGFESVQELDAGQYQFNVNGQKIYALWEGELPAALVGQEVLVIGIEGEQRTLRADELSYSETSPVLVKVAESF